MTSDEARAFWWDAYMREWGEGQMTEPTWIEALTANRFCPRCHHSFNPGEVPVRCPACGLGLTWEGRMAELPVLKYRGGIGIQFMTDGRAEGMLMQPDLYGRASIPDTMEVVVRRKGDCVEVVVRPRVPS
jgi:hypothetical protein